MSCPKSLISKAKEDNIKIVDLKFTDLLGAWQHFSVPVSELCEEIFEEGFGIDGSSMRGWKTIHESDMLAVPDVTTAKIDPFCKDPTLSLTCTIVDPITRIPYDRDPRGVAKKAEAYLQSTGIAEIAYMAPEAEFFIFDNVRYEHNEFSSFYEVDSVEAQWNTGSHEMNKNLGYKIRYKAGYFPVSPTDQHQDIRSEMILLMNTLGIETECHHHEVGTAGQSEIDLRYDSLLNIADKLMWYKYVIKNVAQRHGKTVTFMPKPLYGDNGSGMHTHVSLWKKGRNLFAGDKYAGLSEMGLYFIGGILKHAPALVALTNPTTNSFKRLVPGYEAPVKLAYSSRNRSAAVRIPMYSASEKAKRVEFRTPDPSCNPYLAFPAILLAGIDGIQNKIDPGQPLDKNIYGLSPQELLKVPSIPGSLDEALDALKKDREFLLVGDVFTDDILKAWIDYKTDVELAETRMRPTATEFFLYYDV